MKIKMIKYIDEIVSWNKEFFPDNEFSDQWNKVLEEHKEMNEAENVDDFMFEMADVFIALCGLVRFRESFGKGLIDLFLDTNKVYLNALPFYVEEKIKINKNRVFENNHHLEV